MAFLDLTTFTEVDPNSKITVTSTKADWSALSTGDSARVYKDYGAAHFGGDYEHLWEVYLNTSTTNGAGGYGWAIANDTALSVNSSVDHHRVRVSDEGSLWLLLAEFVGASGYQDYDSGLSYDTVYYCKTKRDEAVGTYGTLYNYVYSDSGRTTLVATQTVTLHENENFQYLYAMTGQASGADSLTGYTQNFDIQEGGGGGGVNSGFFQFM